MIHDRTGTELRHADAARLEAVKRLGQLMAQRPENIWLDGSCSITVVDEGGLTMLLLDLAVTTSPAAPACRLARRSPKS